MTSNSFSPLFSFPLTSVLHTAARSVFQNTAFITTLSCSKPFSASHQTDHGTPTSTPLCHASFGMFPFFWTYPNPRWLGILLLWNHLWSQPTVLLSSFLLQHLKVPIRCPGCNPSCICIVSFKNLTPFSWIHWCISLYYSCCLHLVCGGDFSIWGFYLEAKKWAKHQTGWRKKKWLNFNENLKEVGYGDRTHILSGRLEYLQWNCNLSVLARPTLQTVKVNRTVCGMQINIAPVSVNSGVETSRYLEIPLSW